MRHAFRRTIFEGETVVELGDDAIDVTAPDGARRRIALGDIARVRLWMHPLRAVTDQFICQLEPRGAPALQIRSVSYRLFAYDNRAETWQPLVEHLHRQLARLDPPPQFVAGNPPIMFALQVAAIAVVGTVALVLLIAGGLLGLLAVALVGVLAGAYWYRHMRPNKPQPYDPLALPPLLLPVPKAGAGR